MNHENLKSGQILCAHMPYSHRPGYNYSIKGVSLICKKMSKYILCAKMWQGAFYLANSIAEIRSLIEQALNSA